MAQPVPKKTIESASMPRVSKDLKEKMFSSSTQATSLQYRVSITTSPESKVINIPTVTTLCTRTSVRAVRSRATSGT